MREIRTLELAQSDATTCWVLDQTKTVRVCEGLLWLTVEGDAEDRWLAAGDSIELTAKSVVWISSVSTISRVTLVTAPAEEKRGLWRLGNLQFRAARNKYRML
jgi:hypothetical protein